MANQNLVLQLLIRARDEASVILGGVTGKVAALGAAISAYFGISAFSSAVKSAADFESQLDKVIAKTDDGVEHVAELKKAAEEFGPQYGISAQKAAEGLEILGAAGLKSADAIRTLPPVLALAKAEGIEMERAAALVTDAVSIMGLGFDDAARSADVMVKAGLLSNTTAEQIGLALKYAGGEARTAGLSLEQTASVLDVLAKNGLRGEQAGTMLREVLAQLGNPASVARTALAGLGITTGDLTTVIDGLNKAGPRGEAAIRAFGVEAGPGMRALLKEGTTGLNDYTLQLQAAGGTANDTAKQMQNNLGGAFDKLVAAWDAVKRALVEPLLGPLAEQVKDLSDALSNTVTDGSLASFKTLILDAFNSTVKSVREFIGSFDFTDTKTRLSDFATNAGAALSTLATVGSKAADAVKTAWNGVEIAVNAVAWAVQLTVASALESFAMIERGAAKVGLGTLERANELQARAEDWKQYAKESLAAIERAADAGGKALSDLAGVADRAGDSQKRLGEEAKKAGKIIEQAAIDAADAAEKAIQRRVEAEGKIRQAEADSAQARARLKIGLDQYHRILREEGPQAALEFVQANKDVKNALLDISPAAQSSAKEVAEAFTGLGIKSQQELKELADTAEASFNIIRNSGNSTAADITAAFIEYAKVARASVEQGTEAEKVAIESKLAVVASLANIASQQANANNKVKESTEQGTKATEQSTQAVEGQTVALSNGTKAVAKMDDSMSALGSVANVIGLKLKAMRDQVYGLSEATGLLFERLLAQRTGMSTGWIPERIPTEIDSVRQKIIDLHAEFQKFSDMSHFDTGVAKFLANAEAAAAQASKLFYEQKLRALEDIETLKKVTDGTIRMGDAAAAMAEAGAEAGTTFDLLGEADLAPLRQALSDIRQQTEDATEAARQLVEELTKAKLEREGNKTALEELAYEEEKRKILELEKKNADQRVIENARQLAEQEHQAKLREIEEEEKAAREAARRNATQGGTAQTTGSSTGGSTTGGGVSGGTAPVKTYQLSLVGTGGRTLTATTPTDPGSFLDELESARMRSIS